MRFEEAIRSAGDEKLRDAIMLAQVFVTLRLAYGFSTDRFWDTDSEKLIRFLEQCKFTESAVRLATTLVAGDVCSTFHEEPGEKLEEFPKAYLDHMSCRAGIPEEAARWAYHEFRELLRLEDMLGRDTWEYVRFNHCT